MLRQFCFRKRKMHKQMSSFARDVYHCHDWDAEGGELGEAPKVARAKHRMEYLTDSQLAVLVEELRTEIGEGGGGTSSMVDMLLAWRKKRGDFDDEEDKEEDFDGDEVPQLTSDMQGVSENIMRLGFLKSDLQFECLLRDISYEGSDGKPQLISKLMHYKDTLFLNCHTFQMLQAQCN